MAEQQQQSALGATFPAPPPFWQAFTPENIERIESLRKEAATKDVNSDDATNATPDAPAVRLLDLPSELRFLQPPEPPVDGSWNCFGGHFSLEDPIPSLEDAGVEQLYTPPATPTGKHADRALILKRLAKSLLLNFLELIGIMSVDPTQHAEKIQDLRTLFINFHHLLNEYRPHQARESLILMMQDQLDQSRAETEGIMKMKEKVEGILDGLGETKPADTVDTKMENVEATAESLVKDVWEELDKEFS